MADALCGPSNPLQSFRKHASADRTLQQDRLINRNTFASEEFRTASKRNAGILDAEFEAFQAGHNIPFPQPQHSQYAPPSFSTSSYATPMPLQQNAASWAMDFQRLHISQPQQASSVMQPLMPTSFSGWEKEFGQRPNTTSQYPTNPQSQYQPRFGQLGQYNAMMTSSFSQSALHDTQGSIHGTKGKERQVEERYDSEAFEQAFHEHDKGLQQIADEWPSEYSANLEQVHSRGEDAAVLMDSGIDRNDLANYNLTTFQKECLEQARRLDELSYAKLAELKSEARERAARDEENDWKVSERLRQERENDLDRQWLQENSNGLIHATRSGESGQEQLDQLGERHMRRLMEIDQNGDFGPEEPRGSPPIDDTELANTAGQLLELVADNRSEKFQQSSFLALMRQLRDHEVRVDGDKMVETADPVDGESRHQMHGIA